MCVEAGLLPPGTTMAQAREHARADSDAYTTVLCKYMMIDRGYSSEGAGVFRPAQDEAHLREVLPPWKHHIEAEAWLRTMGVGGRYVTDHRSCMLDADGRVVMHVLWSPTAPEHHRWGFIRAGDSLFATTLEDLIQRVMAKGWLDGLV